MSVPIAFLVTLVALSLVLPSAAADLRTVPKVDLARYAGTWYEIARLPNKFQRKCVSDVRAIYVLRPDGRVTVRNECLQANGKTDLAQGTAKPADDSGSNARLKVSFFWPFSGDYWILDLGRGYEYAVVGEPSRKYLWILSRQQKMDDSLYRRLLDAAAAQGFDVSKVVRTRQSGG